MASGPHSRKKVCYYYDSDIGNFNYGDGHPMKPHRIRMTHDLVRKYGLDQKMEIYRPPRATEDDLTKFHSEDYIRFLRTIRPANIVKYDKLLHRFNVGEKLNCPVFDDLYEFCRISAGGSIAGAVKLNNKATDIAINWAGGLHHAKTFEASGFCYVNDIVLAIQELLKCQQRVLYIDIDIHHGDGVEEAFFFTDRVMTVSFHKYARDFFPETGGLSDIGMRKGKYYSLNFPLKDGMDDESYDSIFKPIMSKVMETYQPSAVVLQCGADSLTGDFLDSFNLTIKGHAECVKFVKGFNLPLLILGEGGYTVENVARCWTYETAVAVGCDIENEPPHDDRIEDFGPDFKLHIDPSEVENKNTRRGLDKIKTRLLENLRMLPCAPGVQMQDIPEDWMTLDDAEEEEGTNPDERISIGASEKRVAKDNEFSDSEDEGEGDRRDQRFDKHRSNDKRAQQEKGGSNSGASEQEEPIEDKEMESNYANVPVASAESERDNTQANLLPHATVPQPPPTNADHEATSEIIPPAPIPAPQPIFNFPSSPSSESEDQQENSTTTMAMELPCYSNQRDFTPTNAKKQCRAEDKRKLSVVASLSATITTRSKSGKKDVRPFNPPPIPSDHHRLPLPLPPNGVVTRPTALSTDNEPPVPTKNTSTRRSTPRKRKETTEKKTKPQKVRSKKLFPRNHNSKKVYQCDHCGKAFANMTNFINHTRTHTGEKPYECVFCEKSFAQLTNLNNHTRSHIGEKLYECDFCGKDFTQITSLNNHIRNHTGEKPYECEKCGAVFTQIGNRDAHVQRKNC